jgi:hypothetical protein
MLAAMPKLPENGPFDFEKSYTKENPETAKESVRWPYKLHQPAFMLTSAGKQKRHWNNNDFPVLPPYNPTPPYKN